MIYLYIWCFTKETTHFCVHHWTTNQLPTPFLWLSFEFFFIFLIIWTKQFQKNLHHNFPRPKVHLWMSSYAKQLGQNPNIFNEHSKGVVTVLPWARSIPWAVCHLLYSGRHWEGQCWLPFGLHGSQPVVKKKKKERNLFLIKLGRRS